MKNISIILPVAMLVACSSAPEYTDPARDADFYRADRDQLKADELQCTADSMAGKVKVEECTRLGKIRKELNQEERDSLSEGVAEQNRRTNEAVKEALENTELDLKWGN